ncbi:MAG: hypothetical protein JW892_17790, partial [Anaerolineae bacterium]|nr:hypothetical protein [Anaerolineae bacterium]
IGGDFALPTHFRTESIFGGIRQVIGKLRKIVPTDEESLFLSFGDALRASPKDTLSSRARRVCYSGYEASHFFG